MWCSASLFWNSWSFRLQGTCYIIHSTFHRLRLAPCHTCCWFWCLALKCWGVSNWDIPPPTASSQLCSGMLTLPHGTKSQNLSILLQSWVFKASATWETLIHYQVQHPEWATSGSQLLCADPVETLLWLFCLSDAGIFSITTNFSVPTDQCPLF